MKIGIIGAGQIGRTLTKRFTVAGHQVSVSNSRGPESLGKLAQETGAKAVLPKEAARSGDMVVVTIPEANIRDLPKDLFAGVPASAVVVDTGNYYPQQRDGRIPEIEAETPESRWVQQQLGRPVVKAFNNIYCSTPARPWPTCGHSCVRDRFRRRRCAPRLGSGEPRTQVALESYGSESRDLRKACVVRRAARVPARGCDFDTM